jgi:GNAT superfamily N-acetyltransferase
LWEFTYLAVHVPPGKPPYPRDILDIPAIRQYAEAWGREGDMGYVACEGERVVGAAWIRLLGGEPKGFGYVDDETPELAMSMVKEYRGQGIGTGLLSHALEHAAERFPGVCLSVDDDNPAKRLYLRAGFMPVGMVGGSVTMVKRFGTAGKRQGNRRAEQLKISEGLSILSIP